MSDRIAEFEEKVRRNPKDTLARFVLAKDLFEAGQASAAAGHFAELTRQKADWMKAWILLGQAQTALGQLAEARAALEEALRLARAQRHQGPEAEIQDLLAQLAG